MITPAARSILSRAGSAISRLIPPVLRVSRRVACRWTAGLILLWSFATTRAPAFPLLWDANNGTAGAQDGSGTWAIATGNWRNTFLGLDNQLFVALDTVTFGNGSGAAGTVTVSGTVTTTSMTFAAPGSGSYSLTGGIITSDLLTPTVSINVNTSVTAAVGSVFQDVFLGTTGLVKTGSGTLTLSGNNTFGGQLSVEAGTLTIGTINNASSNGVLGNSANSVSMGSGGSVTGTLEYTGSTASSTKRFTMATGGSGAFQIDSSGTNLTLSGVIDGSGAMHKTGAGTLTLSGSNTFSGQLSVKAGTLAIGTINNASSNGVLGNSANSVVLGDTGGVSGTLQYTGSTAGSTKKFTMATGGTGVFQVDNSGTSLTLSGVIDGSGGLTKSGAGSLILNAVNDYSGDTTITNGTLKLANASGIPSGTGKGNVILDGGASVAGTLDIAGMNVGINGLSGTSNTVVGKVINSTVATSRTLTVGNNDASSTFAGTILDNNGTGGTVSVSKVGSGTLTLTGLNAYTGPTSVIGGTLQVGVGGTGQTGTGVTTVGDGFGAATLAGTGTVDGTANVTNHVIQGVATLRPGDTGGTSNGSLTFNGNLDLTSNSVTELQITTRTTTAGDFGGNPVGLRGYLAFIALNVAAWDSASVGDHDSLIIDGTLTLGTYSAGLIQVLDNGYLGNALYGDIFDLMDWDASMVDSFDAGTTIRDGGLGGGDLLLPTLSSGLAWDVREFTSHGILMVVPEPSRMLLVTMSLAGVLWRRRRD